MVASERWAAVWAHLYHPVLSLLSPLPFFSVVSRTATLFSLPPPSPNPLMSFHSFSNHSVKWGHSENYNGGILIQEEIMCNDKRHIKNFFRGSQMLTYSSQKQLEPVMLFRPNYLCPLVIFRCPKVTV